MTSDASPIEMLLQKIRQYPIKTQQRTIETYIRYALRHNTDEDVVFFCNKLIHQENDNPGYLNSRVLDSAIDNEVNNGDKIRQKINQRLDALLSDSIGEVDKYSNVYEKLSQLETVFDEIKQSLIRITPKSKKTSSMSIRDTLKSIETDTALHQEAMLYAAQMMFDRLFDSLNPDLGESHLEENVLLDKSLKQAALFEATKETYGQLLAYHQSDKFTRDFQVSYKQYLRKNQR